MATRQYIGARYVPIFDGDWDNSKAYDPLVIVSYLGNSYTSRTFVPAGTDISNTTYWALTGNYNAQVEAYRQAVEELSGTVESLSDTVDGLSDDVDNLQENTVKMSVPPAKSRYLKFEKLYDSPFSSIQGGTLVDGIFYLASSVYNVIYLNIYDPEDSTHNETINLGVNGHGGSVFHYDGKLYITGGFNPNEPSASYNNKVYVYDIETKTIVKTITMPNNTSTGVFIVDGYLISIGIDNLITIYKLIGDSAYHYASYNKELVSASMQGGFATSTHILELRSWAGSPTVHTQIGYDLIVYKYNGSILCVAKLLGMDELEPEWVFQDGNNLYVGTANGDIYYHELSGEFYVQTGWTINGNNNGPLYPVIPNYGKEERDSTTYSGFEITRKKYITGNFNTRRPKINPLATICNNSVVGAIIGTQIVFTTIIARTSFAISVEVRYSYNDTDKSFDLANIRVYDLKNDTYYASEATAIPFLITLGSDLTQHIYLDSMYSTKMISQESFEVFDE